MVCPQALCARYPPYETHLKKYGHPSEVGYKEVLRDWNPKALALYAFCMTVPEPGTVLKIKSLGSNAVYRNASVNSVKLLGYEGKLQWKQEADGLVITFPAEMPFETSVVFRVE